MPRRISLKAHAKATAPRLTPYAAALLALAISVPIGGLIALIDWLWL